jgi:hypothetical protein
MALLSVSEDRALGGINGGILGLDGLFSKDKSSPLLGTIGKSALN